MSVFRYIGIFLLVLSAFSIQAQNDDEIDTLIANMTLEQKVGQMFMLHLYGPALSEVGQEVLRTWQPGAVVLFNSNIETPQQIARLTNSYQQTIIDAGGIPLFIATDQEGGVIARLQEGFTTWPVPMLLTATDDRSMAYRVGQAMAAELRAVGVNMNLAPVADLYTNLANPIIGRRSPGSQPDMVGRTLAGLVSGMQDAGVMATLKHFPGHGETTDDSHTTLPTLTLDRERLDAVELAPFVQASSADTVMVAHIWFTEFDPDAPLPASLSRNVITGLLRDDLRYEGIIMTDAIDMDAVDTVYSAGQAAIMAINAGVNLIGIGPNIGERGVIQAMQDVIAAVRSGEIVEATIDESVRRILLAKQAYGLLDWQPIDVDTVVMPDNSDLIQEVFDAGVTVVYDNNALVPVQDDASVGIVFPGTRNIIRRECEPYSGAGVRWYSTSESPTDEQVQSAVYLASQVDYMIVFTSDAYFDAAQQNLVNALPPEKTFVVALFSPFDWLRFQQIAGYMVTYSPLDAGVVAACKILFGKTPAKGQLAVTLLPN